MPKTDGEWNDLLRDAFVKAYGFAPTSQDDWRRIITVSVLRDGTQIVCLGDRQGDLLQLSGPKLTMDALAWYSTQPPRTPQPRWAFLLHEHDGVLAFLKHVGIEYTSIAPGMYASTR